MNDTPLHDQELEDETNRTGNAPMIPRREVIDILNQVQMLQTRLLIILNQYEPEHFNEATQKSMEAEPSTEASHATTIIDPASEAGRHQTIPDSVRTSDSSGHPEQPVVYTLT